MSFALVLFHILVVVASSKPFAVDLLQNQFAIVVSVQGFGAFSKLILSRQDPHFAFSSYSLIQSFAALGTNCSFEPTTPWQYS
jgi:hypothetical protein